MKLVKTDVTVHIRDAFTKEMRERKFVVRMDENMSNDFDWDWLYDIAYNGRKSDKITFMALRNYKMRRQIV